MMATLASSVPTDRGGRPFQALVAFYPGCRAGVIGEPASDLLILIGKDDTWTPASLCLKYLEEQSGFAHAPTIKVYPGAVHAFDSPFPPFFYMDHLNGRNDEVATDSYVVTKAFFDARLKSK
jgi:dienelactone hydrolase